MRNTHIAAVKKKARESGWNLTILDACGALGIGLAAGSINTLLVSLSDQSLASHRPLLISSILFGLFMAIWSRREYRKFMAAQPESPANILHKIEELHEIIGSFQQNLSPGIDSNSQQTERKNGPT